MYIEKIDSLFSSTNYNKCYNYQDKIISYINKENITKRFNIFLNTNNNNNNNNNKNKNNNNNNKNKNKNNNNKNIKTEIPLNTSNYFFSTYHNSLEDVYKYLYFITNQK